MAKFGSIISSVIVVTTLFVVNDRYDYPDFVDTAPRLRSPHIVDPRFTGTTFSVVANTRRVHKSDSGILFMDLHDPVEDIHFGVPVFPSLGCLPVQPGLGDVVQVTGSLGSYSGRPQIQPLSKEHVEVLTDLNATPPTPLTEALGSIGSTMHVGPVWIDSVEPFTSSTNRKHLRLRLSSADGGVTVQGIIFEGNWNNCDQKLLKSGQPLVVTADITTFQDRPSLTVNHVRAFQGQVEVLKDPDAIPPTPLTEALGSIGSTLLVGPVWIDSAEPFTSRANRKHLRLRLSSADGGVTVQGIIFEGNWNNSDLILLKSGQPLVVTADITTFQDRPSLTVNHVRAFQGQVEVLKDPDPTPPTPLSEALGSIGSTLLVGPVWIDSAEPFTSRANRKHIRLGLKSADGGATVQGIIFEGNWNNSDLELLKSGQPLVVNADITTFQDRPSLTVNHVRTFQGNVEVLKDPDPTPPTPLTEALGSIGSTLLVGPVWIDTAEPFTSRANRKHLRLRLSSADGGVTVQGIIFEGNWNNSDLILLKSGQPLVVTADITTFQDRPSLTVRKVRAFH